MKKLKQSKEKSKKQCVLSIVSDSIKREAPGCGLVVMDLIRHFNRNKPTRHHASYFEILQKHSNPMEVMSFYGVSTVVAKRLGPDGENFYEPVFN